jgi:Zn-dependent protease
MQASQAILYIVILIMSVVMHEVAHGFAAYRFGDKTALYAGRLTLNPIKHLDLFGSIILPLMLVVTGAGFILGWAKPVPYNPNNLSNKKIGTIWVALAGILTNIALAILFALIMRGLFFFGVTYGPLYLFCSAVVAINLVLAIFNLIPIPPLDGSKVLFELLPARFSHIQNFLERSSFFLVILFVVFGWQYITPVIGWAFQLLTGFAF